MNGSEGEAAGLLPAQQKPKRVRRRRSREQVIQPIAVDLQAVPPEQAPGVLGLEVIHSPALAASSLQNLQPDGCCKLCRPAVAFVNA